MIDNKPKERKVLIVATTFLCVDGLTSVLLRLAAIIRDRCAVDFSLGAGAEPKVLKELEQIGKVYYLPDRKRKTIQYIHKLHKLINREHYDTVHIHGNSATMALDLVASRNSKIRITHCHNCAKQPKIKQLTLGILMNRLVTHPVACSYQAGKAIYSKPFAVIRNCIDIDRFRFSQATRDKVREDLGLNNTYVVGHIGRFNRQKNQERFIGILKEILQIRQDAVLMLCGQGELEKEFREKVVENGLADHVRLIGEVTDPEDYLMAMDVLVLPSLFEGLPLAGIEAQASGLPCIFADCITKETAVLPNASFVSLDESDMKWAETICKQVADKRETAALEIRKAGYGLDIVKDQIYNLYGLS